MKRALVLLLVATMGLSIVGCSSVVGKEVDEDSQFLGDGIEDKEIFPQSVEGLVGDTMPFYDDGEFNIFYLADQRNGSQGYHPWGLIKTKDFTEYDDKGVVINYGEKIEDQDIALGTGSVVKDEDGLYHAFYTGHNDSYSPKEAVMHATSKDMENWTKIPEDTFTGTGTYSEDDFRDPYVFYNKSEKCYWMLVVTRANNQGVIVKYTSKDLSKWEDGGVFFENDMGTDSNMECPTLLEFNGKWYLSFSDQWPNRQVHYRIADRVDGPFEKPEQDIFDSDGFYAGRMETDGENLYVVGWNGTKKGHTDTNDYDWGGNMVTHLLKQHKDGTLTPVSNPDVEEAMSDEITLVPEKMTETVEESDGTLTFSGKEYEYAGFKKLKGSYFLKTTIEDYSAEGKFGFAFNTDQESVGRLNLVFNPAENKIEFHNSSNVMEDDAQSVVDYDFSSGDPIEIKMYISNGVVSMYVNDQVAMTARMYMSQGMEWGMFSAKSKVTFTDTEMFK